MSRRRRGERSDYAKRLFEENPDTEVEVACTDQGRHGRELLATYDVYLKQFEQLTDGEVAALPADDHRMLYGVGGVLDGPVMFPVVGESLAESEPYATITFRCDRCGRNRPMRDMRLRSQLVILARHGYRRLDISRV